MMKKMLMPVLVVVSMIAAGCNDGKLSPQSLTTSESVAQTIVPRADLVAALWGTSGSPTPDALCLSESTFTIDKTNPIMIMIVPATAANVSRGPTVVDVSPVNIVLKDGASGNRGTDCPSGALGYSVPADDNMPIEIVVADAAKVKVNLNMHAGTTPREYPQDCTVIAHFDRNAVKDCTDVVQPAQKSPTTPSTTTPATTPTTTGPAKAETAAQNDQPASGADDGGNKVKTPLAPEETPDKAPTATPSTTPQKENPQGGTAAPSCVPPDQTVVIVIDDYDCKTTTTPAQPYGAYNPSAPKNGQQQGQGYGAQGGQQSGQGYGQQQ